MLSEPVRPFDCSHGRFRLTWRHSLTVRFDSLSAVHSFWRSAPGRMPVTSTTSPVLSGEEVRLA